MMSDSEKTVAFIDSAPAGANDPNRSGNATGYGMQGRSTSLTGQAGSPVIYEATPSYMTILNSQASVPEKMKQLAVATKQKVDQQFSTLRPWSEFFDRSFFASPANTGEAVSRLNTNVRHFSANYIVLSLVCSSYILLINLTFSICVLAAVSFYLYVRTCAADLAARGDTTGQIYILHRPFTSTQLYGMLAVFSLVAFWLFNGGSVVFWLALTSLGVTSAHAMMRRPPLNNDDFAFA